MKRYITLSLYLLIGYISVFSQEKKDHDSLPLPNQFIKHPKPDGPFSSIEVQAEFPGGEDGWRNFLIENLNNDVPGNHHAPKGRYTVKVSFIVDKDGSISDISTPVDPGYGTAQEVIRVMKKSPKWRPGIQNGRFVKSWRSQNITFQIDDK